MPKTLSQICHSFSPACALWQQITPATLEQLITMLSAPGPGVGRYIVASRQFGGSSARGYVTTVFDENSGTFYRAAHPSGISVLLKSIAANSSARVICMQPGESYTGTDYREPPRSRKVALPARLIAAKKGPWRAPPSSPSFAQLP